MQKAKSPQFTSEKAPKIVLAAALSHPILETFFRAGTNIANR